MKKFLLIQKNVLGHILTTQNLFWLFFGSTATYTMAISGLDAYYFTYFQDTQTYQFFKFAGIGGFLAPPIIFISVLLLSKFHKNKKMWKSQFMLLYATWWGWFFSTLLKFFTGRAHPPYGGNLDILKLSHEFHIGFNQGGIFWGWPSSHTSTAVAAAFALIYFYPKETWLHVLITLYAGYIAMGASLSFHWLSDVIVGVIIGYIIGKACAKAYEKVM